MARTTPHSVLAFHLMVTLCICPLLTAGLDKKISPEDLKRGLERMAKAYSLYSNYDQGDVTNTIECVEKEKVCGKLTKQLIIREVLMRNTFKFIDEACNTHNQEQIFAETPNPNAVEDQPFLENYYKWQDKAVFDSGKIFCDPFKNLFCSSENKCACSPEKEWKIGAKNMRFTFNGVPVTGDTCIIPQGGRCISDGYSEYPKFRNEPRLYDPLSSPQLWVDGEGFFLETREPFCDPGVDCSPFFNDYFYGSLCLNDDLGKRINNVKKYFNEDVKGLKSGEECNFDGHNQLFKIQGFSAGIFNARLKAMESFQASGGGVCDLRNFHTCGKSGKCECLEPTVLEGAECTLPASLRTCGNNTAVKAMIMENNFVPEAQLRLAKGIEKLSMGGCGTKSRCHIAMDIQYPTITLDMFCICNGFFTGENCDEVLTLFLPFTRPSALPSDVKDVGEKFKIFSNFNKEAIKFQEKLKLKSGEKCDFYKELEIREVIRRIDDLNERNTFMSKLYYENLTKTISNFAQSGEQYCLRNLDPERRSLIEHSPYNQPIECEYSSRVCKTPLSSAGSHEQIQTSLRSILETHFSTLGCGEPCTKNIDYEGGIYNPFDPSKGEIDRLENNLYEKTTFCVRSINVGAQIKCETQSDGVNRKCVCRGPNCTRVCSNLKVTSTSTTATGLNLTNHGISRLAINNGGSGVFLLFQFLTPFTLSIYGR